MVCMGIQRLGLNAHAMVHNLGAAGFRVYSNNGSQDSGYKA